MKETRGNIAEIFFQQSVSSMDSSVKAAVVEFGVDIMPSFPEQECAWKAGDLDVISQNKKDEINLRLWDLASGNMVTRIFENHGFQGKMVILDMAFARY